ncbi:MAG TPA: aminodeoxychorismate synthase component I [Steroidobacteraceae bacterium]|nr:aminodeoxychorismate synthase component I [Steroidobacteraceae bacterium]
MSASTTVVRALDVPPAVLRQLARRYPERYPALFDSVAAGPLGRASILAARSRAALWLTPDGRIGAEGVSANGTDFLFALENWWRAEQAEPDPGVTLPFAGGWVVFLAYEAAQLIEPHLVLPRSDLPWQAFALRTPCALVHDLASDRVYAVGEREARAELELLQRDATAVAQSLSAAPASASLGALQIREEEPAKYLERVRRAQEYIRAGDIYQANLSRPWRVEAECRPGRPRLDATQAGPLYERLCAMNPAPFAALAQYQDVALLSSSPERLIRVTGRDVETRPIAGTRPRSRAPGGDAAEAAAMVAHPKERAEHIMLIDLERNDLGRVCEAGSVRVDELMVTETYAHVHHIVSNVRGRLRPQVTPIGALRAVFPGGTITGCPKFRCMQIIAELEGEGRGAYTGSLGFLGRDGRMDLNILIRTMTLNSSGLSLRAGAGIVADSIPERELEETRAKARGMLAALEPERVEASA